MIVRFAGPNGHVVVVDSDAILTLEWVNNRCSAQLIHGGRLDYNLIGARQLFDLLETAVVKGSGTEGEDVVNGAYDPGKEQREQRTEQHVGQRAEQSEQARRSREREPLPEQRERDLPSDRPAAREAPGYRGGR